MRTLIDEIHAVSPDIRYVAICADGRLESSVKAGLAGASSPESDKYEELIVNPTLVTLLSRRGDIDCGGMQFVIVRYGNFFEFVAPIPGGHVSVGIDERADPLSLAPRIQALADRNMHR